MALWIKKRQSMKMPYVVFRDSQLFAVSDIIIFEFSSKTLESNVVIIAYLTHSGRVMRIQRQ